MRKFLPDNLCSQLLVSWLLYLFFACCLPVKSQELPHKDTVNFCVMSYNVENLFDCRHDSLKNDYEFLPAANRHWTYKKYRKKLDDIARVILAVGRWSPPALVGLCEIENDSVLYALTHYSLLRTLQYRYLITHSDDERGIDVGLLYQRQLFKPLIQHELQIPRPAGFRRPTRNILHVCGLLLNQDTLDVLVCHFPSRTGGAHASEPYRLSAANIMRQCVDSLYAIRKTPQILIMGDFNDYPHNQSIRQIIGQNPTLHHLLAQETEKKRKGSYKYKGEWGLLDHIIVSPTLLHPNAPLYVEKDSGHIFHPEFLLIEDKKFGGYQPFRTYLGMKYQGGFSDHLPVWADFRLVY